jgi:hypothetical protein
VRSGARKPRDCKGKKASGCDDVVQAFPFAHVIRAHATDVDDPKQAPTQQFALHIKQVEKRLPTLADPSSAPETRFLEHFNTLQRAPGVSVRSMSSSGATTHPKPGVFYRIQSVDFGTFLELYDVDEPRVVLRPEMDSILQQVCASTNTICRYE